MTIKIKASEAKQILDNGEQFEDVETAIFEATEKMSPGNGDVTLTLVIENDLEPEEEEEAAED